MARVLVVEDEQTDRLILAGIVEGMGHEVYFASDGEQAFKTYMKMSIDVVVTDLLMPHVDGLEFIEELKTLFPEAPVIAVSGKGPELLATAEDKGACAALTASPSTPRSSSRPSRRHSQIAPSFQCPSPRASSEANTVPWMSSNSNIGAESVVFRRWARSLRTRLVISWPARPSPFGTFG